MSRRMITPARRAAFVPVGPPQVEKLPPTREEVVAELRQVYRLLKDGAVEAAMNRVETLGKALA